MTCLMTSLLAAFVAMLGKQWLNRYLRNSGGSMIERCGDRQRKFNGQEKWPLHFFVESLPVMLQVALLLLACGLCRHMWTINPSVAYTLISLTGVGVGFYVAIVITGMSSYVCPFQTPTSVALRDLCHISLPAHTRSRLCRTARLSTPSRVVLFKVAGTCYTLIELVGYEGFEGVGIERLVELLNCLHVAVEDMV